MQMWDAGVVFAAVHAVTRDKKPVTNPFLGGIGIPEGTALHAAGPRSFCPGTAASSSRV
ncbi:hypothetical protein M2427_000931 [Bradyrhizobium sp. BR13661]|jgi:hypothetical protein|nr:hypothetical protein [Bradyrhizobium sp. BR13661]